MDIRRWRTTAASNTEVAPDGMPENMASAGVNDWGRESMAQLKTFWDSGEGYYAAKSSNYPIVVTDDGSATTNDNRRLIDCTATLTLTLPAASGATAGWACKIHNSGSVSTPAVVTLTPNGSDTINGVNSSIKFYPGESVTLIRTGSTAWKILFMNARTLIQTQTASASSTIDFTTGIDDTQFAWHEFHVANIRPTTDGDSLYLRVRDTTFQSDAADYAYHVIQQVAGTAGMTSGADSSGAAFIEATRVQGNASTEGANGLIRLWRQASSGVRELSGELNYFDNVATATLRRTQFVGAYIGSTNAIDGVRFLCSTGTIAVGTIRLYGVRG